MPQAIEWSFATPKISAFLPSSRPIRFLPRRRLRQRAEPTIGPVPKAASTDLRAVLAGVRAFILDADGVLMFKGAPIAGSAEALVELRRRGIPYRVVTNFSSAHRSSLAAAFGKATGQDVDGAEIITAASARSPYGREHHGKPILVIAAQTRGGNGKARSPLPTRRTPAPEPVAAVVIGDAGDDRSFRNMDIAFRQVRAGAAFVASIAIRGG